MRGHEYARTAVLERLRDVLPIRLAGIRAALEVATPVDPPASAYLLADSLPDDPGQYPCVVVMSTSAPVIKRQGVAGDGESVDYIVRYSLRIVVACRLDETGGAVAASLDRDRLLLAVREALISRTAMPEDFDIEPSSISEQTGAAAQDLRGRPLAAGEITVTAMALETLRPLPEPSYIESTAITVTSVIAAPNSEPEE